MKDTMFRAFTAFHKAAYRATGGRLFGGFYGMPAVILTTIGRKSGEPRSTPLTAPVHDDDRVVLVASYGGDDRDPQWYKNISANPDVELTMRGDTRKMTARAATPDEKEELWPRVVEAYKGYGQYQTRTTREIPLVILTPRN